MASGQDGEEQPIHAGQAVIWSPGEHHESEADDGGVGRSYLGKVATAVWRLEQRRSYRLERWQLAIARPYSRLFKCSLWSLSSLSAS